MNVLGEPPEGLLPDPRLVGLRVMLRIAVTSPVRSLPALPAHRQHPGATRAFCLAAPARRANIQWRTLAWPMHKL
jgi:hypothetical protein